MTKKQKRLIVRVTLLLIVFGGIGYTFYLNFFTDKSGMVKVGEEAPNFVLEGLDGTDIRLSEYRGKGVFLNFWGTYCPPCEKEMPYMQDQYERFAELGVEILAVNVNETNLAVSAFVNRYNLTYPIPMDRNGTVVDAYGIRPLPTTILIDKNGIVTERITGGMTEEDIIRYLSSIVP